MHFEILVEDISGKKALENLIPRIIGPEHSFTVHSYKGIGHIPKNLKGVADPAKRILLDQLPRLLQGFGRTFASYPADFPTVVVVVCDLDSRCLKTFRAELLDLLGNCHPRPKTCFCIAVEEGEAWFLGDPTAIQAAYPKAKQEILKQYQQDAICGTWECLADAIYPGGAVKLKAGGWQAIGNEKSKWAEMITPLMNLKANVSPSFAYFYNTLQKLAQKQPT